MKTNLYFTSFTKFTVAQLAFAKAKIKHDTTIIETIDKKKPVFQITIYADVKTARKIIDEIKKTVT